MTLSIELFVTFATRCINSLLRQLKQVNKYVLSNISTKKKELDLAPVHNTIIITSKHNTTAKTKLKSETIVYRRINPSM